MVNTKNLNTGGLSLPTIGVIILIAIALLLSQVQLGSRQNLGDETRTSYMAPTPEINQAGMLGDMGSQIDKLLGENSPPSLAQVAGQLGGVSQPPVQGSLQNASAIPLDYKAIATRVASDTPGSVVLKSPKDGPKDSISRKAEEAAATLALGLGSMYTVNTDDAGVKRVFGPGGWFDCAKMSLDSYAGNQDEQDWWIATPPEARNIMIGRCSNG